MPRPSCPPVVLATTLRSSWSGFKAYPRLFSSALFVPACRTINCYSPIASSPSSPSSSIVSTFPSISFSPPSNLSSSCYHFSSLLLLLFSCFCSWVLSPLPSRIVTRNCSTAEIDFLIPCSCLIVFSHRPTCLLGFCYNRIHSFCQAINLNIIWWTSIPDLELHS